MSRPTLKLARAPKEPRIALSLVKQAIRLYRGKGIAKATYRRNARAWIAARLRMGDKHILKGASVSWGIPGDQKATQVYAPRRQGERA